MGLLGIFTGLDRQDPAGNFFFYFAHCHYLYSYKLHLLLLSFSFSLIFIIGIGKIPCIPVRYYQCH
jgi:hypothetical protein